MLRTILLCAALAGAFAISHATTAASVAAQSIEPVRLTWNELRDGASRCLGRRVCLDVQFHSRIASWNPYLTRFGSRDFSAVRAWSDEQFPWVLEHHGSPAVRFFVRRGSACDQAFDPAQVYERYEIRGIVREIFAGEPWIEIEEARVLPEQITEGAVIHAGRAIQLFADQQWKLADADLERALAGPLPQKARAELERLRDMGREAQASTRR